MAAARDPAARAEFYRELVASDLLIVDKGRVPEETGRVTLEAGRQLRIRNIEVREYPTVSVMPTRKRVSDENTGR